MERVRCNTELFLKSYRITRPTFGVHFIMAQPLFFSLFFELWIFPLNTFFYSHSIVEGGFDEMS